MESQLKKYLSQSAKPGKWQTFGSAGLPENAMWIGAEVIDCSNFFNSARRKRNCTELECAFDF